MSSHQATPVMATWVREVSISPGSSYFLRVDVGWPDLSSGFQLLLTDGQSAWRGEVSAESVQQEASELEMQEESYIQDLKGALTEAGGCYRLLLTPSPPQHAAVVTLTYEKVQEEISFQLGSVLLRSVSDPTEEVRRLLLHSLDRRHSLHDQNYRLEQENQTLRQEHQRVSDELMHCRYSQESWEDELFRQFLEVLNTQKALTRVLQESVKKLKHKSSEETNPEDNPEEVEDLQEATSSGLNQAAAPDDDLSQILSDMPDVAPNRKRRLCHRSAPAVPAPKRIDPPSLPSAPSTSFLSPASCWEVDKLFDDI